MLVRRVLMSNFLPAPIQSKAWIEWIKSPAWMRRSDLIYSEAARILACLLLPALVQSRRDKIQCAIAAVGFRDRV